MKLKNLHIENIRSYKKLDFNFEDGVTVISGVNGSGKSSLLEACFMGLFGSKSLSKDFVLADIIFKGADTAKIELGFEHLGREYLVDQAFRYSSKNESVSNSKCVLYADGESVVDQATRTYEEICALLNMDEEAYRNCAYIRQGEIDVLINAKPKDRQRMIDDLLQLGRLEEYRERAGSAKTAIRRLERDTKNSLSSTKTEISEIENAEPFATFNSLKTKVKESEASINKLNGIKEAATSRKEKYDQMISEYKERLKEASELDKAIQGSQENKTNCFREKETFLEDLNGQKEALNGLDEENNSIRKEYGFETPDIDALILKQEKEDSLSREKLNGVSKELALSQKEEETHAQALLDLEKEKAETERIIVQCRKDIGTANREIEENRSAIKKIEEDNKGLREKAGFGENQETHSLIKELEEKERLLFDEKSKISAQLALTFKEKETEDKNSIELDKELQNRRTEVQKSKNEIEILEEDLRKCEKKDLEVQEQKAEALTGLKELGFSEEQLEDLEDFNELLQENKNRLLGREKELEVTLKELEKILNKNKQLLADGKCPTCGQELKGSEIACTTEEAEQKKEKLAAELIDIKPQQAEIEKKLNRLKDTKKLAKSISDYAVETEKLNSRTKDLEERIRIYRARIEEDSLKLETLSKQKEERGARINQLLSDIKALQTQEKAAQKVHSESENVLREAKAFEKKLAENLFEIEALKGKIRTSLALIENHGQRLEELKEKLKGLANKETLEREKLKTLKTELEALREKEEIAKKAHQKSEMLLLQAKKLQTNLIRMDTIKHKISEIEASIRNLTEKIGFFEKEILEKRERVKKLAEKLEENRLEDLQHKRSQCEEAQANIAEEIKQKTAAKDSLLKEIGMIENRLKRLKELKNELQALENKRLYLESVFVNTEELENTYMRVRADMRVRNIGALSSLLNEMFDFMYANNAYSHIELDPEYNLTVHRKDGTPLEPKLLSGGERAIFNLILRCAIYRLLALGFGGSREDGMPPMILDEPTVFLDRGHVRQLLTLIDMMRNIGVGQIIIVSHDETLIDSADHVFQVEKDPLTNMSSIMKL